MELPFTAGHSESARTFVSLLLRPLLCPEVEGVCDKCGNTEFKRRKDDNEEAVRTRMAEYRKKTAPILPFYEDQGIVTRVDGMAGMDEVSASIESVLAR